MEGFYIIVYIEYNFLQKIKTLSDTERKGTIKRNHDGNCIKKAPRTI